MQEKLRFLGLDVHAETIAVAIAEPDGEVRGLGAGDQKSCLTSTTWQPGYVAFVNAPLLDLGNHHAAVFLILLSRTSAKPK
jgi:uncharacterized protein (DUF2237 family)